ncbi:MAG TPA: hypothetical protein PKE40_15965 [Arachnia sp.]|nr:hypothetical protein [Arachnia sp.]HMT87836.1 hypothetical protein [Arachnia sp.]
MRTRAPSPARRGVVYVTAAAVAASIFGVAAPAAADDVPPPTAHYDMSHTGTSLLDVSGNGRNATLSGLTGSSFVDADGDDVLRFRNNGYAILPQGLVTGSDNNFTVEYTVTTNTAANQFGWVIGDGIGAWNTTALGNHVFVNPMTGESAYNRGVLSGIRVKDTGNGETRLPAGGGLNPGFTTLTLVGSGNTLTLYRDGAQISTVTHSKSMSAIVPSGSVLGYLGRSLYTGDALLTGDVTDVKFWDQSLSVAELQASMPTAQEKSDSTSAVLRLDLESTMLGSNPSLDAVSSNLVFPATLNGVALTWQSSNPAVVSGTGAVSRTITEDTPVTITVNTGLGTTATFHVTVLAPDVSTDLDAIALKDRTTENLPLVTVGAIDGAQISWTSSDPALVTPTDAGYVAPAVGAADPFAGGGIVERPAYGAGDRQVTLTATATLGSQTEQRTFEVTVAEHGRTAPDVGYAAAYFKSDSDERIYQAATSGNDFFTFSPVNGGAASIVLTTDTKGLRDPYILRSAQGDKYYMVATDLCIGCGTGWGPAQSQGSLKIHVWESTDLVNWVRTNDEDHGIVVNQPRAGMTWAPEVYWDDDLQSYVVFFASRLYSDETHSNTDNLHARMFYVLTRDFRTFTYPPVEWQNTGYARIDSTVMKIDDYYYRFTKNEDGGAAGALEVSKDIFMERSKVLTAPTSVSNWNADPETTWQLTDTNMTRQKTNQVGEGPEIVKLNPGDPSNTEDNDGYVFLVDNYGSGGYRAFVTTGAEITSSQQSDRISRRPTWTLRPAGGLPASPRHGAFVNVPQTVLSAMHTWSEIEAVDSTTTLTAQGRDVTAQVVADDQGEVVGTVTFTGGSWSETVDLVDGEATVSVPEGVSSVVAHYDGYADGLVNASTSEALVLDADLDLALTATTRCVAGKVQQILTVRNNDDVPVTVALQGTYGSKTVAVAAGSGASAAFASRLATTPAVEVSASAQAGDDRTAELTAEVAAANCS